MSSVLRTTRTPTTRRLAPPDALRRVPPGSGTLVYGDLPPVRLRLRTWFDDPWLRARAVSPVPVPSPAPAAPGGVDRWARVRGRASAAPTVTPGER